MVGSPEDTGERESSDTATDNRQQAQDTQDARLIVPEEIRAMWKRHIHHSDRMREFNAMLFFNDMRHERDREENALQRRTAKRQRQEEEQTNQFSLYPQEKFVRVPATAENDAGNRPDVKGSVLIPGESVPVPVEGYALIIETSGTDVLLVLCPASETAHDDYYPALCAVKYLPTDLVASLKRSRPKSTKVWSDVDFSTVMVKRGKTPLHFMTGGPFINHTCDQSMVHSLESGIVAIRGKSRAVYGVTKRRFAKENQKMSPREFSRVARPRGMLCALSAQPKRTLWMQWKNAATVS